MSFVQGYAGLLAGLEAGLCHGSFGTQSQAQRNGQMGVLQTFHTPD